MAERLKMNGAYAVATNIVSSLGNNTKANWNATTTRKTGIKRYEDESLSNTGFMASKPGPDQWQVIYEQTRDKGLLSPFEMLAYYSAKDAVNNYEGELKAEETVFILSTTKGNIELLGKEADSKLMLSHSAGAISKCLGLDNSPIVVSHACVSGVIALDYALRILQSGRYKNVIVTGCDRFSRFVLSGFQSFHAISPEACRPFDADRKGITLGEAAASIILTSEPQTSPKARLLSGATSNDANHISGPSRTGEELAMAISRAMEEANIGATEVDMISAHGTATAYNDEMEAKAFGLTGLNNCAIHSFKGFTGHTLGAAGVMESAIAIEAMQHQMLLPSIGYEAQGVSVALNITRELKAARINHILKTASGFGGCNAALVWGKE